MGTGDPYTTVTEPTFVARFLIDPGTDTVHTVASVDAFVDLPDGSTWSLTIVTVDEVGRLLARWRKTGEVANGSYFWAVDQLIVPEPGVPAMTAAIRELVRSGDITSAGARCEDESFVVPGNGIAIGEMIPLRRHRVVTREQFAGGSGHAPAMDAARFRADADSAEDGDLRGHS